jgi:hypothetical protein
VNTHRSMTFAATVVAVGLLPLAGSAAAATPARATIASANAVGFRAVVRATETSGGRAPSASLSVAAYRNAGGTWRLLGDVPVGRSGGFFWKVLTGRSAIRAFSISTTSPQHVTLQVLVSPALGWSPVYTFHVERGTLVRG